MALDTEQAGSENHEADTVSARKPNGEVIGWNIMSPLADALPFPRDAFVPAQKMSQSDTRYENGALRKNAFRRDHFISPAAFTAWTTPAA